MISHGTALALVACIFVASPTSASPFQLPFAVSPPSRAPVLTSTASSFHPLLPPAIPLAVRSPYLNAWLSSGGPDGSGGMLAGGWAKFWPVRTSDPPTTEDCNLGWSGLVSVDGVAYEFMGHPTSYDIGTKKTARQTSFLYTATRSVFSFTAGDVDFNVTFLTPITPHDYVRMSLPLSYLSVEVERKALRNHSVSVYTDISGEWASGDFSANITWSFGVDATAGAYDIKRKNELQFSEHAQQAEWGSAVYATTMGSRVTTSSGQNVDILRQFVRKGRLAGTQDVDYRRIDDRQVVFGFAVELTVDKPTAVFSIGHVRSPYVNYVTPDGMKSRKGFWTTKFSSTRDLIAFHLQDYAGSLLNATLFDSQLRQDAERLSGSSHAAIVELSVRQAFATFELTVGDDPTDVLAFLKEISSNGDMSTVDVTFPLHPLLLYTNPELIKLLLEPIMIYTASGLYPNRWTVHDLGVYPNATGHNDGNDEPMPIEEAGNMLWMILAYWQQSHDTQWVVQYYDILKQWTQFLVEDGLIPDTQLSTDDFAGTLSNQTNLAMKAIVGIGAMAQLSKATGHWVDYVHFDATARAYAKEWYDLALTPYPIEHPHAKLAYQDEDSHGLLYNLFGDRLLNLGLFDRQLYEWQSAWYVVQKEKYGVPLDSRHAWTKTDWECFAAASAADNSTRDMFFDSIVDYLKAGNVDAAFPDLYETNTADFPGRQGMDWNIQFIARPVVGGHFSLLALDVQNKANNVKRDPFRGSQA